MKVSDRLMFAACVFFVLVASPAFAGNPQESWAKNYRLVLTDISTPNAENALRQRVTEVGGRVAVTTPPSVAFCWLSADQLVALRAADNSVTIISILGDPEPTKYSDPVSIEAVKYFKAVLSGEFFSRASTVATGHERPDVARAVGAINQSPLDAQNDGMVGYVNVAMIFPQCQHDANVPDSDNCVYSWSMDDFWEVFDDTWSSLSRWSAMASNAGQYLTFSLGSSYPLTQPYEPILHAWTDHDKWVNYVLEHYYGYGSEYGSTAIERVNAWNEWRRTVSGAHAATAYIVVKNGPGNSQFTDGWTSGAYRGGPFVQMPYLNARGPDAETAHELGHIFWSCDEYGPWCYCGSCTSPGDPALYVWNCNCVNCSWPQVDCIMHTPTQSTVCPYTAQKIGWRQRLSLCEQ